MPRHTTRPSFLPSSSSSSFSSSTPASLAAARATRAEALRYVPIDELGAVIGGAGKAEVPIADPHVLGGLGGGGFAIDPAGGAGGGDVGLDDTGGVTAAGAADGPGFTWPTEVSGDIGGLVDDGGAGAGGDGGGPAYTCGTGPAAPALDEPGGDGGCGAGADDGGCGDDRDDGGCGDRDDDDDGGGCGAGDGSGGGGGDGSGAGDGSGSGDGAFVDGGWKDHRGFEALSWTGGATSIPMLPASFDHRPLTGADPGGWAPPPAAVEASPAAGPAHGAGLDLPPGVAADLPQGAAQVLDWAFGPRGPIAGAIGGEAAHRLEAWIQQFAGVNPR